MKGFVRNNQYLSLCGLNCKLCPMNLAGHCSGCGVDNQSCKIAKCSIEHGKIEYCFQCTSFPCDKYAHIDDFDSFMAHHNQMNDMEKASQIGIPAYNAEQEEKRKLLDFLLSHYNDGRRKNLFCVAVNLLTIKEIENILQTVKSDKDFQSMGKKEQASVIAKLLQETISDIENDFDNWVSFASMDEDDESDLQIELVKSLGNAKRVLAEYKRITGE